MAWTLIQSLNLFKATSSFSLSTGPLPWPSPVTPGNGVFVFVWTKDPFNFVGLTSLTDDEGNTYTADSGGSGVDGNGDRISYTIFRSFPVIGGTNLALTWSNFQPQASIELTAVEIHFPTGFAVDTAANSFSFGFPASGGDTGTLGTSNPNELALALFLAPDSPFNVVNPTAPFSTVQSETDNATYLCACAAIANLSTAGAWSPSFTIFNSSGWGGCGVAYTTEGIPSVGSAPGVGDLVGDSPDIETGVGLAAGAGDLIGVPDFPPGVGVAHGVGALVGRAGPLPCSAGVITDAAKLEILNYLRTLYSAWSVALLVALDPPSQAQTIWTVTEASFPGYSRRPITHVGAAALDGLGHAIIQADAVLWTNVGLAPVTILGWGYVRTGSFQPLRSSGVFAPAKVIPAGGSLALTPTLDDTSFFL